jgi:modulator of FtsH protease
MTELRTATTSNQTTSLASKTFLLLTLSMAIASGGAFVGFGLNNPGLVIACMIANLVGLFILWAVRENTALSLAVLTGWMALSGITVGVMVQAYVPLLGAETVIGAFLGTVGVTAVCGAIATFSGIDFRPLQKFLFIGLLGLIVVGVVSWFVKFSPAINLLYSSIGMILFVGYFLVDFYRLAKSEDNSWREAISLTVSIYLDIINFFSLLLRFLNAMRR